MKIMIRRSSGESCPSIPRDWEEPFGHGQAQCGVDVSLANGWRLELPMMSADTALPITVDARRLIEGATGSSAASIPPFDPVGE